MRPVKGDNHCVIDHVNAPIDSGAEIVPDLNSNDRDLLSIPRKQLLDCYGATRNPAAEPRLLCDGNI